MYAPGQVVWNGSGLSTIDDIWDYESYPRHHTHLVVTEAGDDKIEE